MEEGGGCYCEDGDCGGAHAGVAPVDGVDGAEGEDEGDGRPPGDPSSPVARVKVRTVSVGGC